MRGGGVLVYGKTQFYAIAMARWNLCKTLARPSRGQSTIQSIPGSRLFVPVASQVKPTVSSSDGRANTKPEPLFSRTSKNDVGRVVASRRAFGVPLPPPLGDSHGFDRAI